MLAALQRVELQSTAQVDVAEEIYLWPECEAAWRHFWALGSQWHYSGGMDGAKTGLHYACVQAYLDEEGIAAGPERRELFGLLRVAEEAALQAWADLRSQRTPAT